jgi:hypothetical protein|tara:strand:- start:102 stop:1250 length:1149 start_codon:yes stop_codon:yes gene_type:complete
MGLLGTTTEQSYYSQNQTFTGDGSGSSGTVAFALTTTFFPTLPVFETEFDVFINGTQISTSNYSYSSPTLTFSSTNYNSTVQATNGAPLSGLTVLVRENSLSEAYGGYQHISLDDVISNFMISYVGTEKIINRVRRADVAFHAQRALQEFSYDTFKSTKSFEVEVPPTLILPLPQDYVSYVKICWIENGTGIERNIYPTRNSSNPRSILQDSNYNFLYDNSTGSLLESQESKAFESFKSTRSIDSNINSNSNIDDQYILSSSGRYGITPENAQVNGSYYIDQLKGNIHFSSSISGKNIIIKYISDSLGTDGEMVVHKFAEEAMYKYLAHAILSTKANIPEYIVNRFKKEKFAATRTAKLRLSNLKSEEIAQVMRNKSKVIKH